MKTRILFAAIAVAAVCAAALTSQAYMKNDRIQVPDSNGHVLTSLWKAYYAAEKADQPKRMAESLDAIKKEARARRLHWDFYDAALRKLQVESSRNWKLRQELRTRLDSEIEEYGEPIVTYSYRRDQGFGNLTDYVLVNKTRLQSGRNSDFYQVTNGEMNGLLNSFIKDDYEYALWAERYPSSSKARPALKDYLGDRYPNAAWLEFRNLDEKPWENRKEDLEAFVEKYSGKAVNLFGKASLFRDRMSNLSIEDSDEAAFKALYAEIKSAEKERKSYISGADGKIAARIDDFKCLMEELERKEVQLSFEDGKIVVAMRNLDKVDLSMEPEKKGTSPLLRKSVLNPRKSFHIQDTVKVDIPACDDGDYVVKARNGKLDYTTVYSPKRLSIAVRDDAEGMKFYVADYLSGQPVPKVDLRLSLSGNTVVEEKDVAVDGFTALPSSMAVTIKGDANYVLEASCKGGDGTLLKSGPQSLSRLPVWGNAVQDRTYCKIFTDKGAYNPGETLKFKAVLYRGDITRSLHVLDAGQDVFASLCNAEGKEVGKLDLQTNGFGSVAGEFPIPTGERNGRFTLEVGQDGKVFSVSYVIVDEFVLPTFDLTFENVDSLYFVGDEVEVRGVLKSYSGHPLDAASLSFEVDGRGRRIASGDLDTDAGGAFSLRFKTVDNSYFYTVSVKVTDPTGETKVFSRLVNVTDYFNVGLEPENAAQGQVCISAGSYKGATIFDGDKARIVFKVVNSEGSQVPVPVRYELKGQDGKTISSGLASSEGVTEVMLPQPGLFTICAEASVRTSAGKEISSRQEMTVLRVDDGNDTLNAAIENFFKPAGTCADGSVGIGEDIHVRMGAGEGPVWAVVELFGDRKQPLARKLVHLVGKPGEPGSIADLVFEYKEDYPDVVLFSVFYFRKGHHFTYATEFRKEKEENSLPLSFSSFEDKTLPGKEYSFRIGSIAGAELVAAVFDKSSEKVYPNRWSTVRLVDTGASKVYYRANDGGLDGGLPEMFMYSGRKDVMFKTRAGGVYVAEEAMAENSMVAMAAPESSGMDVQNDAVEVAEDLASLEDALDIPDICIRSDFASSVAFEPFLRTGDDGSAELRFRTSDKLSTVVVQVFAHTPDMLNSVIRKEMTVSVPVKVSVAEPGYLFKGDRFTLHATVSSASDAPVSGTLVLQAFPSAGYEGMKPFATYSKKVTVPAGGSVPVAFDIPPKDVDTLGLKIVFADKARTFSDGVFVSLPVLEAEQTITESHSAVLLPGMDKETLVRRLQSEFTGTSSMGAGYREIDIRRMLLEAIPSKVEPDGKDVLSLTEAYYVRKVSERLGSSQERIMSDEELLSKINACRNADGGFAWFQGMGSSPVITAVVLERLARLRDAGLGTGGIDPAPSVVFLDRNQFIHGESWPYWCGWLSPAQYAFVRSLFTSVPFDVSRETKSEQSEYSKNFREFRKYIKDYLVPSRSDGRGLNGQILAKARRIGTLLNITEGEGGAALASAWGLRFNADSSMKASIGADVESLYEYAVEHRDGGWYYPNAVMPWRGLLESELYAHSLLCNLLSDTRLERTASRQQVQGTDEGRKIADGIRIWIMLQKETQKWADDPAFVDAINSVMSGGEDLLSTSVVVLEKTYREPFSRIVASGNGFSVERRFFKEVVGEDSKVGRLEIYPGMQLHVGDKVVCEYRICNQENRSFVKLTAPREAAFRPVNQLSGHTGWWARPIGGMYAVTPQGYRNVKSDRTEYFFDVYPEENTTVTEEFFITQEGTFTAPVVTIESQYAPHYRANDKYGGQIVVR